MWDNSHLLTNHYRYSLNQAHDRDFTVILSFSTIFDKKIIFVLHKLRCLCYFCSYNSGVNCLFALMFCLITCEKIIFNATSLITLYISFYQNVFVNVLNLVWCELKLHNFFIKKFNLIHIHTNTHTQIHRYVHRCVKRNIQGQMNR